MPRLDIQYGDGATRSPTTGSGRTVNLYSEKNPPGSPTPLTFYPRPGLRRVGTPPVVGVGRGCYVTSGGDILCAVGQNLYHAVFTAGAFVYTLLGSFLAASTAQVSMCDNRTDVVIADGTGAVYAMSVTDFSGFTLYIDPNGLLANVIKFDYIDTYLIWNVLATNQFASSLSNSINTDPLYLAALTGKQYNLTTLVVNNRQILLLGVFHCELWYDAGGANFPFAEWPGIFVETGCVAPYSVAQYDKNVFWLSQDLHGHLQVMRFTNYSATPINDQVVANALKLQLEAGHGASDATGYCYQQRGHSFYCLTLGDCTWAFDMTTGMWAQRGWTDPAGTLHRERVVAVVPQYGLVFGQDWENGGLYVLDDQVFTDDGAAVVCTKGLPHVEMLVAADAKPIRPDELGRVEPRQLVMDLDTRLVPAGSAFKMSVSQDRGLSWQAMAQYVMSAPGDVPLWWDTPSARDPIYELSWSFPAFCALNGAWLRGTPSPT